MTGSIQFTGSSNVFVTQSSLTQDVANTSQHLYALGLFSANTDQSVQIAGQNFANTSNASTDLALYNNIGTDTTNYIDMGITSTAYNVIINGFTVAYPGDGYVYTNSANLVYGTFSPNTNVKLFVGGYQANNTSVVFNSPNTKSISNSTGTMVVKGDIASTGNVNSSIHIATSQYIFPDSSSITGTSSSVSSNSSTTLATSNAVYIAVSTALAYSIALG
jgi:hypothetical protein